MNHDDPPDSFRSFSHAGLLVAQGDPSRHLRDFPDAAGHHRIRSRVWCSLRAEEFYAGRSAGDDGLRLWRAFAVRRGSILAGYADRFIDRDAGIAHHDRQHPLLADEREPAALVRHIAGMAVLSVDAAGDRRRLARCNALSQSWRR